MSHTTAVDLVNAMTASIQLIPAFTNKSIWAYNDDDLIDKIKGLAVFPGIAVVYEGMRSKPEVGVSAKVGISAEAVISLVVIDQGEAIVRTDQRKINVITYLDALRSGIMATRSPTSHFWQFLVEAPAEVKKGMVFWVSRWSTPIQLAPPGGMTNARGVYRDRVPG
jgi:hypothetical protein